MEKFFSCILLIAKYNIQWATLLAQGAGKHAKFAEEEWNTF